MTFNDIDELMEKLVLYAIENEPTEDCFFEPQGINSIFYKVYDDISRNQGIVVGAYFANRLKEKYEISIPIR